MTVDSINEPQEPTYVVRISIATVVLQWAPSRITDEMFAVFRHCWNRA